MYKPKLVIVSSTPLTMAVTKNRLMPFINLLLAKDINVELVCPISDNNETQTLTNINIIEVDIEQFKPKNFFKRALKELSDARSLLSVAKSRGAEGYLVTIPSMFLGFLAPYYLNGSKAFLDIRDLQWEYLSDRTLSQKLVKKLFRVSFNKALNFFEGVAVTNDTELSYVSHLWNGSIKPILVTNGIMKQQFDKLKNISNSDKSRLTVTYIGNIGIAQNLTTLASAAKKLPDVDFVIVGSGIEYSNLERFIEDEAISNINLVGRVPWDEVEVYYNRTHILYAQLTPQFSGAMPSKLYEYLATGKFIIYGGTGQAIEKLKGFSNNVCIPPCDPDALVNTIKNLKDESSYNYLSLENRELIEKSYIRENAADSFITEISKSINLN